MPQSTGARSDPDTLAADVAERYLPRLRMFALRRLRVLADADDAAQETLRRILVALRERRVLDLQALPAYVFETARHVCAHHARRSQRTQRAHASLSDLVAANSPEGDPLSILISAERVQAVREALAVLAPEDRELLRLTYAEGLSADLIAERLGLSAGNVRVRRHRVQKELARRLRVTESPHRAPAGEAP
jgi:RNA polymerase sigma-70 factor (ECF subfamily)